ncbi:hypothetical protein OE88DRAFT_1662348 [Heliocybe sulcata]|uniref:Uncharacterized protein n=1 Tax=Heliocybe sulcata TaxID=5364 RepID=A0A5C3MZT0_9AGAM|nr:hypothetical protein OE88DRAFT_1662348 [Heliocybe sulcata]
MQGYKKRVRYPGIPHKSKALARASLTLTNPPTSHLHDPMDFFTVLFSSPSTTEDDATLSPPVSEESGGDGGNSYCVVA